GTFNNNVLLGDVNDDGIINVLDIVWLANYILGNPDPAFVEEAADVNEDTTIDISDVVAISNIIMGGAKDLEQINSDVAYVSVENGILELESDGTLTALQFKLEADNASELDLNLLTDSHKLSYAVKDNVLTGLIYSLNNNAFPEGITKLLSIENLNSFNYKQLIAANINAESVEVLPKDATLTEEFNIEELELAVFPNPNAGNFTVTLELPSDGIVELQLFDVTGREVMNIPAEFLLKGSNQIEVNMETKLNSGFYILKLTGFNSNGNKLLFTKERKVLIEN
ncbi:MAG: T9SS type A sorting domain-containing protein, partial [Bacteroidales bacterium]